MTASYDEMNQVLLQRGGNDLLFLPYIVGTNAPEFDTEATGVFWGLRQEHDAIDMAGAVMEGVSFVLRKNCEHIAKSGVQLKSIIATGGGAKSAIWCQMQADITGLPVSIPKEKEAACLGAALIGAVSDGRFESYSQAVHTCVELTHTYEPHPSDRLETKYRRFNALYKAALAINEIC
jgi:sugar (pentulose or hexulose) kinase